jgi:small subunit ribosomal protein S18
VAAKAKRSRGSNPARPPTRTRSGQALVLKRKSCFLCKHHVQEVDYKNVEQLRRYTSERGKIRSRRMTGACRRHQRQVALAIKRAREMALLPYVGSNDAPPARDRDPRGGGRRK